MTIENKKHDIDPQETKEWIDSINGILNTQGIDRAHFIIEKMIEFARRNGVKMPYSPNTAYVNTIPLSKQQKFPGDRDIERRINGFLSESIDRRYLASIDCDMLAVNPNSCRTCHKRDYSRDLGCGP